ncbi:hypothetical protein [Paenibacillus popilliae]|uniref:Periplasmic component n=1 Tax=Paenibacillus popilliae ATCC 14706 TaxID=1212764 RepID=M9L9U6_PAEPP|nr:hypothetical protein [Paenibacillus popilliae]GAC42277.1 periplasmic component [Paenibacillus popilliae ATCC 14706]
MSKKVGQLEQTTAPTYTKAQFLASSRFTAAQRDILAAVLADDKTYTDDEARKAVESYLRKEVK